jgi:hypothetical protein
MKIQSFGRACKTQTPWLRYLFTTPVLDLVIDLFYRIRTLRR